MYAPLKLAIAVFALCAAAGAAAQQGGQDSQQPSSPGAKDAAASMPMADGEVRKVDKDAKKITIKHGELKSLGMPPMTMVFQVRDSAMLDQVKAGDKISFVAEQVNGKLTVTKLEPKK